MPGAPLRTPETTLRLLPDQFALLSMNGWLESHGMELLPSDLAITDAFAREISAMAGPLGQEEARDLIRDNLMAPEGASLLQRILRTDSAVMAEVIQLATNVVAKRL